MKLNQAFNSLKNLRLIKKYLHIARSRRFQIVGALVLLAVILPYQNCSPRMGNPSLNNSTSSSASSLGNPNPTATPSGSPSPSASPSASASPTPSPVAQMNISINYEAGTPCALTPAGVLKCWGGGIDGTLGDGRTTRAPQLTPEIIDAGTTYKRIDSGYAITCGITSANVLKCWGLTENMFNVVTFVGQGSATPSVMDPGVSYIDVAATLEQICAITTGGILKCAGHFFDDNYMGNGLSGANSFSLTPIVIDSGVSYASIVSILNTYCGITSTGALKCWGANSLLFASGILGDGTTKDKLSPEVIDPGTSYSEVSLGNSACGITIAGVLKCWGDNTSGRLGDGTTTQQLKPEVIDAGTTYAHVSVSSASACAVTTAGVLKCWGDNSQGQLGDGTTTQQLKPEVIDAGTTYSQVATGTSEATTANPQLSSTCGVTTAGMLKCWGDNTNGQLGDGTTKSHLTPELIDAGVTY